ncbi:hypothetical protein [Streptomyces sp. NBC_01304]|uniref:hypothetical protein n=1 Tax=Streptomyces sp. NBC_01304 TaxID=2903818 RepID=UPI002E168561|nr:hypothetical protein OG430_20550 [Streptomyces sp. NBC_01304]
MKATLSRGAVSALVVAALGFTAAGCGGKGDSAEGKERPSPSKAAAAQADKPKKAAAGALSAAQLAEVIVGKGDVAGYKFEAKAKDEILNLNMPAKPEACQAVADMFFFGTQPEAKASLGRNITPAGKDSTDANYTSLVLLSHEQADAEKVIGDLRTSVEKCGGKYEHLEMKYDGVKALPAPEVGDEAVSYRVSGDFDGDKMPMFVTVVRSGSTLVAASTLNYLEPEKTEVPAEVIEAQLAKLKKGA